MRINLRYVWRWPAALALALVLALAAPVQAIGPGTGGSKIRVSDQKFGPYVLLVATSPLPVTVGQLSVWVRVTDAASQQLRREAVVMAQAGLRGGGQTLTVQATHQNAGNDYDYVAHFEVNQPGQWDITVTVDDAPGQVKTSFTETVTRGLSATVFIAVAVPFVVLAVVAGLYLWRRSAQER
jgi:FlaG/FlaF family flagellin (archaellin)